MNLSNRTPKKFYTKQERAQLHRMVAEGKTYAEIATTLGRSVCAVHSQVMLRRRQEIKRAANARSAKAAKPEVRIGSGEVGTQITLVELVINSDLPRKDKLNLIQGLL